MGVARVALIRVSSLTPSIRVFAAHGVGVERFLERAGLSPRLLAKPESLVPLRLAARCLDDVARAEGCPTMGLQIGDAATLHELGVFGQAIERSTTLREVLDALLLNAPAYNSGVSWWLEDDGPHVRLCHRLDDGDDGSLVQVSQQALAMMRTAFRRAAGPRWDPVSAQLAVGAADTYLDDGRRTRGTPIRLDPHVTAMTFERALFARTMPRPASIAPQANASQLDDWRHDGPASDFPAIVIQIMRTLADGGAPPSIAATSSMLGMSVRTLQRWLAARQSSYEALVGRSRLTTARALLEHTDAKVIEIALELGYSDHAHFTRAFRRWTGLSPRAYRHATRTTSVSATG